MHIYSISVIIIEFTRINLLFKNMQKPSKNILWFDEITIEDVPKVGGKNASLGEMTKAVVPQGVNVPYGFATTFGLSIPVFFLLFGYFVNMWLTNGNLRIVSMVGALLSILFFVGGGVGISLPAPMYPIIYGCLAASIAGYILSIFKQV